MEGSSSEAFSSEIWDWAYAQIPKVAAKYPDVETAELEAELARQLLKIRRKTTTKPRDWKAYLFQCLLNGASRFADQYRKRRQLQPSIEAISTTAELFEPVDKPGGVLEIEQTLRALQQRVSNADRRLLMQLRECDGNVSRLAAKLGQHRNTIHRRLRRIRRTRCPIEIETAPMATDPPEPFERAQLLAVMQAPSSSARQVLRARVILALLDGLTYDEIVRRLGTSRSTIARWRARFTDHGISGVAGKHPGKKPSPKRVRLVKHLRALRAPKRPSARHLARRFGLGKSTAQRILKFIRDGALSSTKTL